MKTGGEHNEHLRIRRETKSGINIGVCAASARINITHARAGRGAAGAQRQHQSNNKRRRIGGGAPRMRVYAQHSLCAHHVHFHRYRAVRCAALAQ